MRVRLTVRANFSGSSAETRRREVHQQRRRGHAEQGDRQDDEKKQAADTVHELPGFVGAAPVPVFAENRHKGLRESAFGKQPAQQVGQLEGDKEGVGEHPGTKGAGNHEVADETENPRQQGHAADGGEGLQEVHCAGRFRAGQSPSS
jgi:hypothetical protein